MYYDQDDRSTLAYARICTTKCDVEALNREESGYEHIYCWLCRLTRGSPLNLDAPTPCFHISSLELGRIALMGECNAARVESSIIDGVISLIKVSALVKRGAF